MWAKRSPGGDLHPHEGVPVARVPPVVPDAGLDDGGLAPAEDARLPVALDGQLALEDGEALDEGRVARLAGDARAGERGQLHGRAALGILVGKLEDPAALAGDEVLPDLADLDRCEVRLAIRVGVRHPMLSRARRRS
jgi:hypothetical protein